MRHALRASLLAALSACTTRAAAPARTAPPPAVDASVAAPEDPIAALNRRARAGAVVETLHGVSVDDPYRSLETDSPETRAWIDAQTARSAAWLDAHRRPETATRLAELLRGEVIRSPRVAGPYVFWTARDEGHEQYVLRVADRRGAAVTHARDLVDPTSLGARAAIDWVVPSPRGRYVAMGVSQNGDERSVLRVVEVATGRMHETAIPHAKWCRLSWLPDETGFYFTRYPREGEAHHDPAGEDTYWRRVYFHALSSAADGSADPLVFEGEVGTDAPSPEVSPDGRWLVINLFKGWNRLEVLLIDRRARVADGARPTAVPVIAGDDTLSHASVHRGRLYVMTNRGAPRYRVLSADVAALYRSPPARREGVTALDLAPAGPWRVLVPEGEHVIDDLTLAGDRMVLTYTENVASRVYVHDLNGRRLASVALPADGTVPGVDANDDGDGAVFSFQSFFWPSRVYALDRAALHRAGEVRPAAVVEPAGGVDPSRFALDRASVPSRDGTPVNVFLLRPRGMTPNGDAPVLLTGYGGFNISLLPRYSPASIYWLERGGVYAVANLRGGGEFGETWHRDGALDRKEHVFEDFESVIRWLSSSGLSRPERIAITGGSNGGLLMGAMLTRAPDAFGAVVSSVGLYDMVRFARFPPASIWASEYGDPERADAFRWLYAYSPYHRVREGQRFPATWIETADHDTRVYWGHSTKFAARLQEAQSGDAPIFFYMQRDVGHGAGTRRDDEVNRWTRLYTFIESQLQVNPPSTSTP